MPEYRETDAGGQAASSRMSDVIVVKVPVVMRAAVNDRAHALRCSGSAVVREAIARHLGVEHALVKRSGEPVQ